MRRLGLSLLILGLSLVSACGVKSPPRPPKSKPTQTSQLTSLPGNILSLSGGDKLQLPADPFRF